MNDDLRRGGNHCARERIGVEHVDYGRLGAEDLQSLRTIRRACGSDNTVTPVAEQRNKTAANDAAGTSKKYFHVAE